jgi:hypothetical protein
MSSSKVRCVSGKIEHDAMLPIKHLEVSRKTIIYGPNMHMEIGIPRRKDAAMVPGVKPDYLHRLVSNWKPNFGFFV